MPKKPLLFLPARLLSKQGAPEAEEAWRALIEHNADNYSSYRGYLSTLGISLESPSSSSEALAKLEELSTQLPRATAPRRLQLTISSGEDFKKFIRPYIVKNLAKGVPSLFTDIKTLYVDAEKRQVIEDLVESLKTEYAKLSSTTPSDATNAEAEPTTYLWTLYFLAQHYSYLNQPTKALELLEEAITHTPTLPELYLCKGRALKRVGDYLGAAKAVNEARFLDGQDRFINTKCGKYLLRAGMVDEATGILGLFTKVSYHRLLPAYSRLITSLACRKMLSHPLPTLRTCSRYYSFWNQETRTAASTSQTWRSKGICPSRKCSMNGRTINSISMGTI